MQVERSGWAFWVGLLYTLFSILPLGLEAYTRYSGISFPSPYPEQLKNWGLAGSVCSLFFGITLMGQRKSVYFWTVLSVMFTIIVSGMMIHYDPSQATYIAVAISAVLQLLLFILVINLMVTGRLR